MGSHRVDEFLKRGRDVFGVVEVHVVMAWDLDELKVPHESHPRRHGGLLKREPVLCLNEADRSFDGRQKCVDVGLGEADA